jgi:hypothetical protein
LRTSGGCGNLLDRGGLLLDGLLELGGALLCPIAVAAVAVVMSKGPTAADQDRASEPACPLGVQRGQAERELDDLVEKPPTQHAALAPVIAGAQPLPQRLVGNLNVGSDHLRLHRDHENAVGELAGQKQVDGLYHLGNGAR